jgi:hypothetical protein
MIAPQQPGVSPGARDTGKHMMKRAMIGLAGGLCLLSCGPQIPVDAPTTGDLSAEAIHIDSAGPPEGPEGACWAHDLIPAVYETTTEQSLVTPERRNATGQVVAPATYKSVSKLRVLQERRDIWFISPCPEAVTPEFLATLQRALKARGYYQLALTGLMDEPTTEALRRYQADHGLDSPLLSLAAARQLGVATVTLDQL